MLSRLINVFASPSTTTPSALLVIGRFGDMIDVLHLVPEDGTIERRTICSPSTTFHSDGSKEQAREQIGTVTIHTGDGETAWEFLNDVQARIHDLQNNLSPAATAGLQTGSVDVTQLVQGILKPAAFAAIHERESRHPSMDATEKYPVFVVYIKRPRAGKIVGEPKSINY